MAVQFTWYGHSALGFEVGGTHILVDPFLSGNPAAAVSADTVQADYILISHGHGDHVGDALEIAKRTGATVVSNFEICNWFERNGYGKVHAQHIGGGFDYPFGRVQLTIAHHGSALPDGSCGGNPCGFLLTLEGKKIYDAADTGLFYDMSLIGEHGLDLAMVPIGDNFTMGPVDALRAIKLLHPKVAIPIHYDTWEVIQQDEHAWANVVREQTNTQVLVLQPGQSYTVQ